jgi:hypothetical protein
LPAAGSALDEMHDLAGADVAQLRVLEANAVARAAEATATGAAPPSESAALFVDAAAGDTVGTSRDPFAPFRPTAFGQFRLQHGMREVRFPPVEGLARAARKGAA